MDASKGSWPEWLATSKARPESGTFSSPGLDAPVMAVHETDERADGIQEFVIQPPIIGLVVAGHAPFDDVGLVLD
jgi:hypothetical protein